MGEPAVLYIIGGADRGKSYKLILPETRVGRGADQDLVLADIAVSRRHFTLHAEGGRFRMRDLGSGNGTLVNGQRVDGVILNDGDQIECGNTLMRFDQQNARAVPSAPVAAPQFAPPPAPPPPQYAEPPYAPPPAYAPPSSPYAPPSSPYAPPSSPYAPPSSPYAPPSSPYAPPSSSYTPPPPLNEQSAALDQPPTSMPPSQRSVPLPLALLAPLGTPKNRMIALATMGGLSLLFLGVILARTAFAKTPVVASEAEESYRQGIKLFIAKDYEGAKVNFEEALKLAPDSTDARRYVSQCDVEAQARVAVNNAERNIVAHRYGEAVKQLDAVDSSSLLRDESTARRKEIAARASVEALEEAKRLWNEDQNTATAKLAEAMELDPNNTEARSFGDRTGKSSPKAAPPVEAEVVRTPPPKEPKALAQKEPPPKEPKAKEPKESKESKEPKPRPKLAAQSKETSKTAGGGDDDLAPVRATSKREASSSAKLDVPASATAAAAYKARDFAGAERAYRKDAAAQNGKQMDKTIAYANQVADLKRLVDKATADEAKSPQMAAKEYEEAASIDARIGKGQHGQYFRSRVAKLSVPIAQQALQSGNFEAAFKAAQAAQKLGQGDGGVLKQLDAKAKELTDKGVAVQKSNLAAAKQYWRQVLRMVPSSSPSYARAYQLINQTGGAHKDEDED